MQCNIVSQVKPSGILGGVVTYTVAACIWSFQAAKLALKLVISPRKFLTAVDRSFLDEQEPLPGVVHEYLCVNGIRLHAASLGRQPDKPLMLFIHGFPEFWYSWKAQLQAFSKDYDAVAIDMRGYGQSDKPSGISSYNLDLLASDVAGVVQALGHERCVLVAHDWGGFVAWVTAGMYPQVIDRLVTMAGPHLALMQVNLTLRQALRSWYMLSFQWPWISEWAMRANDYDALGTTFTFGSQFGPRVDGAFSAVDREWYKHAFSRPGAATASINYYRALMRCLTYAPIPSVWRALHAQLPLPCCAIMAADDPALEPGLMNKLDQVAPASERHVLERCGHWVQNERPVEVNRIIREFLSKHPPTRRAGSNAS